jgi:hypothetical protein
MLVHLQLDGLAELRAALRQLPADLVDDAAAIVEDTTDRAMTALLQSYPEGETGHLRRGVKKTIEKGVFGVEGLVKSTSPHAHLWEFGTVVRHTARGWNRGRAPRHYNEGLVGIATRERRRMNQGLVELVRSAGFEVSGAF